MLVWFVAQASDFSFLQKFRLALGPTHTPVKWVPWEFSTGCKEVASVYNQG